MTAQPPLTDLDRAILDVLTSDPQASARMVADALDMPLTKVVPRMRAMDRRKVSRVLAVLDLAAAGQQICFVLIDVRRVSVESVAARIAPIAHVILVSTLLGGTHDLLVMIRFRTVGALHDLLFNQIGKIEGIYRSVVSIVLDIALFRSQYLRHDPGIETTDVVHDLAEEYSEDQIDEVDRQIIAELLLNARQSIKSVARKCQINASTVRYRIRSLESRGLMRFITVLNPPALGIGAFALVEIEPEPNRLPEVIASLRNKSWLPQIFVTTGSAPIKGILQAENARAIMEIKNQELTQIEGIIRVEISTLVGTRKMDLRWGQKYV
ncbi:winged helix-turn-helix transcriptional regulator [Sphingobium sp. AN641]|uniref:Lrp/AsnC family transcriptional regulator n=1 Tax=Sphingobium sp. AN641 TaxID=3133443 RepID=UPI0030BF2242